MKNLIRKKQNALIFTFVFFCSVVCNSAFAQVECGTPNPKFRIYPDSMAARALQPTATYPLLMKVYVFVFANNDGSELAAADTTVMRQLINMRNFFASRNICFTLVGYEIIYDSDMNNHYVSEEDKLIPFLASGCMNIFVHRYLQDYPDVLNGMAYNIPNYYLSIASIAIRSSTNISTLSHEMGHDFGLYHTFQAREDDDNTIVRENVARSGSCKNCVTEGDLLCDTEADRDIDENLISSTNCTYGGTLKDACNTTLLMTPTNIMTYGRRSCRSVFTNEQGARCQNFILTTPFLSDAIAPDNIFLTGTISVSSGRRIYVARNSIGIASSSVSITGTATANFVSRSVTLPPGVHFAPSAIGYTAVRANRLCD